MFTTCYHCGAGTYGGCECTSGFRRHRVVESDYQYDTIPAPPKIWRAKQYGLGPLKKVLDKLLTSVS